MKKPILSIVIINYNTPTLTSDCLRSLEKVNKEVPFEVIVIDNASTDDSVSVIKENFKWITLIVNDRNAGFAGGNNKGRNVCRGKYVLLLNSDTVVHKNTLSETVKYLETHPDVGAVTCKLLLPSGGVDKDMRRSFPTPWVSFTHLSHLDRLFPNSQLFSKYWYGYKSIDQEHEIDVAQGAFNLIRRHILDEVDWLDETYFLDGEDIDLCWKIKEKGWKIMYYPRVSIIHIKGASKGKNTKFRKKIAFGERKKYVTAGVNSMEIFYKRRLWKNYPIYINIIVIAGIKLMKTYRIIRLLLS